MLSSFVNMKLTMQCRQPKPHPKSAAATKAANDTNAANRGKGAKRGRGGRARNARPAKKTAEELDSEMADYFDAAAAPTEAAPAAAAGGDAPMDDEIL
jgi:THO complex subunit 4